MKGWPVVGFFVVIAAAMWFRCGDLARRPLHNDEAINAFKLRDLWEKGEYRYDPHEYHGPSLYYLSLPFLKAASWWRAEQPEETAMRSVTVVVGIAVVALIFAAGCRFGREAGFWAAAFAAVSPLLVYYSRYYIHEMLLVLGAGMAWLGGRELIGAGETVGASERNRIGWAMLAGLGVGLMWTTKETFVFSLAAAVGAWGLVVVAEGLAGGGGWGGFRTIVARNWAGIAWRHWSIAMVVAGLLGVALFSSMFAHPMGPLDSLKTYVIWGERAGGGTAHRNPWHFFLERLFWYRWPGGRLWTEALIGGLAAVAGIGYWVRSSRREARECREGRMLGAYAVLLGAVYSVIPYKTPWCALGFFLPLVALAGSGASSLRRWATHAWGRAGGVGVVIWILAGSGHLAMQAWRGSREWGADFRNPWVYGHTSADIYELLDQVREVSGSIPEGKAAPLWVVVPESNYWPLPWYFRDRGNVGWWDALPKGDLPPMVVIAVKSGADLESRTRQGWVQAGMFELRPRFFVELYVESGVWKRFLEARAAARNAARP